MYKMPENTEKLTSVNIIKIALLYFVDSLKAKDFNSQWYVKQKKDWILILVRNVDFFLHKGLADN